MSNLLFNETVLNEEPITNKVENTFNSVEEIDEKIKELEKKLQEVKGTETEVYTRIVGYHRDVRNWNNGKKEEYKQRITFKLEFNSIKNKIEKIAINDNLTENNTKLENSNIVFYKVFHNHLCRNCPPVLAFLRNLNIPGEEIDVSTEAGLNSAKKYNIMSTPSVILFDKEEKIVTIANSIEKLKEFFPNK